jgi:hypothetical protein
MWKEVTIASIETSVCAGGVEKEMLCKSFGIIVLSLPKVL